MGTINIVFKNNNNDTNNNKKSFRQLFWIILRTLYNRRLNNGHTERQTGKRGCAGLRGAYRRYDGRSRISIPLSVFYGSVSGVCVSTVPSTAAAVPRTGVRTVAISDGRRRRNTGTAVLRAVQLLSRGVTAAVLSRGTVAVSPAAGVGVPASVTATVRTVYRGGRVPLATATAVPSAAAAATTASGRTV